MKKTHSTWQFSFCFASSSIQLNRTPCHFQWKKKIIFRQLFMWSERNVFWISMSSLLEEPKDKKTIFLSFISLFVVMSLQSINTHYSISGRWPINEQKEKLTNFNSIKSNVCVCVCMTQPIANWNDQFYEVFLFCFVNSKFSQMQN